MAIKEPTMKLNYKNVDSRKYNIDLWMKWFTRHAKYLLLLCRPDRRQKEYARSHKYIHKDNLSGVYPCIKKSGNIAHIVNSYLFNFSLYI